MIGPVALRPSVAAFTLLALSILRPAAASLPSALLFAGLLIAALRDQLKK
jgi:hypothetical protein